MESVMLFENFFSLGSLIAISFSLALTINYLKINFKLEVRNQSHNINGNNNTINIYELDKRNNKNFQTLSVIISVMLLVLFPFYPSFFLSLMKSFSWLPLVICLTGVFVQIYMRGSKRIYDIVYVIPALIVGVLMYHALYLATHGNYIHLDIYPRLFNYLSNPYFSFGYLDGLNDLLREVSAYLGFVILFLSAIYISFAFIIERNFDSINKYILYWVATAFFGNFLAAGILIEYMSGGFIYIEYAYKLLLYFFKNIV